MQAESFSLEGDHPYGPELKSGEFINKPKMSPEEKEAVISGLEPGDFIWVEIEDCPISPLGACVERATGTNFSLFSTDWRLTIGAQTDFNSGSPNLKKIAVRQKADAAVPEHSKRGFKKGDKLKVTGRDQVERVVTLVGAMNGMLYCLTEDGQPYSGGANFFQKVEE